MDGIKLNLNNEKNRVYIMWNYNGKIPSTDAIDINGHL